MARKRRPEILEVAGARWFVHSYPIDDAREDSLSEAEREVAKLVAQGLSNAQIAEARGTSVHTVGNQISSILRKLGVGSRFELIARSNGNAS